MSESVNGETAELHAKMAAAHLKAMPVEDRYYTVYLSRFNAAAGDEEAYDFVRWWIMQNSFSPTLVNVGKVDPKGRLLFLDIREARWSREAWAAVADRDKYFVEPAIGHETAKELRELTYHHHDRVGTATIVRLDLFLRDTMETVRNASHYDLLYSEQRFKAGKFIADFPKDLAEWQKVHGIKAARDFLRESRLQLDHGAVSPGSFSDPDKGSIVTNSDRVIVFEQSGFGTIAMESFDVRVTAGATDFLNKSGDVSQGKIDAEAGELLSVLPGGGLASLLIDRTKNDKRIELASTEFARNPLDKRFVDVRNRMSCIQCHSPEYGVIPPKNLVEETQAAGIETKFVLRDAYGKVYGVDKEKLIRHQQFFTKWSQKVRAWQLPGQVLAEQIGKRPAAWFAKYMIDVRDVYDAPVTAEIAAKECGVPLEQFKSAAAYSPGVRLQQLLQGKSIPRSAWERDTYSEAAKLLALGLTK